MEDTWISIQRKFKDWEWYKNIKVKTLFLHLLLIANFKDNYFKNIFIKRGQTLTSLEHLADDTGLTIQQTRTALNKLKLTGEITTKSTNKFTLITIVKYDFYQKNNKNVTSKITNNVTNNQQTKCEKLTTNNKDINNNIYLYLFNIYSEKISGKTFAEKIRLVNQCKNSEEYLKLNNNEQNNLFNELMRIK